MTLPTSNEKLSGSRRSPQTTRLAVRLWAMLWRPWQADRRVELRDISPTGFRGVRPQGLKCGSAIVVEIPGLGPVEARVKWVDGDSFGAEFAGPPDIRRLFLGGICDSIETRVTKLAA